MGYSQERDDLPAGGYAEEDDGLTDDERTIRERRAHPIPSGPCDHSMMAYTRATGRVVCALCEVEFVEADYVVEAVARIEGRMAFAEGLARGFLDSAAQGMKQLAASPAGMMLGLEPELFENLSADRVKEIILTRNAAIDAADEDD